MPVGDSGTTVDEVTEGKSSSKSKSKRSVPKAEPKERTLQIESEQVLRSLLGEQDQNIRRLEERLEIRVGRDTEGLLISGLDAQVDLAFDLLNQLSALLENGQTLFPGDIDRSLKMLSANRHLKLADVFRDQIKVAGKKTSIIPKTLNQKIYLDAIRDNDLVFGVGPAGTGKTYLAMAMATSALLAKSVKRIVLCRPAVEAGEKLGFLPGDMAEKVNPYLRPLYDALYDMVEFNKANEMIERGIVEVAPLAFMRGRTLSKCFVILDEAQNTTQAQMKMFLTRLGQDTKCIVTGDISQIDLPRGTSSGLVEALDLLSKIEGIGTVRFAEEDVIRHPLVARIVRAYDKKGTQRSS